MAAPICAGANPHCRPAHRNGSTRRFSQRIPDAEPDPPRKLVIAWDGGCEVSFELTPQGEEVLLTVIHRRLPDRAMLLKVAAGWHTHLDILVARANGAEPATFWDRWSG
ncbi:hypothetical protein Msil_2143 [Methylocella silvestris BL2]|uniref:Activator of Hsp90 ATPase homologue 1/2-like C-terminal domain-containing protein n=1 Tax=Methylocella silvestris (strain DSM 15510 / CIP 108128 / LMG 27833 / NCIMB 13906 / BL2) TaxID=395965 RepID=B8ERN0_METSB|nr:SRPBCC domain-containing protein [Methylocella silvestris]ACK51082.1 hypothetical protein Msil_2143 [Methylocella silvestris BL2]